ncbi:MAG TPA: sigma-54 dependent transcriptional regulator [Azohydromonas sp.]|nr:sigma-54 dependent transcriptional regulator [Azohydromonas sp.]
MLCIDLAGQAGNAVAVLRTQDAQVDVVGDLAAAEQRLRSAAPEVVLLVATAIGSLECDQLSAFVRQHPSVVWVGAFDAASIAACRELIVNCLFDHHTLPFDVARLASTLGHARGHAALRRTVLSAVNAPVARELPLIIGNSKASRDLLWRIRRVAEVDAPVLVTGESGSGKELAAQYIHRASSRAGRPFVAVNCGAIPGSLIQSELFGHEKGSFTGADRDKRGIVEAANGGTLFLDEIGDLSRDLQVNLLRFLQEKTITRVGSSRPIGVDVRVISATHVALERAVACGDFREDLYYRLNVLSVFVPPLRERTDDIEVLAQHFFRKFEAEKSARLTGFSDRAIAAMRAHPWPGNVRELVNRVRRAMVMAPGRLITPADLGLAPGAATGAAAALDEARTHAEQSAIAASLAQAGGNVTAAARHLRVSRMTLYRLMAKHGLTDYAATRHRHGLPIEGGDRDAGDRDTLGPRSEPDR